MENVKNAKIGKNVWIPLKHKKLSSQIAVTKGMYILLGGASGAGKTGCTDSLFVLDLYDNWKKEGSPYGHL